VPIICSYSGRRAHVVEKKIKSSIKVAMSQYHILLERFVSTQDDGEKAILCRRLVNLLGVIQFLISVQKIDSPIGPFV